MKTSHLVVFIALFGYAYSQFSNDENTFDLDDAASEEDLSVAETAGGGGGKGGAAGKLITLYQ